MKLAANLLSQVELSTSLIEIENKRILDLCALMTQTISKKYPLEAMVGNNMIYHKSSYGTDLTSATIFRDCNIAYYSRLSPHVFKKGDDLNNLMNTHVFNKASYYVLYVSADGLAVDSPLSLVGEILAIELRNDQ